MFVRQSTYDSLRHQFSELASAYRSLQREWNDLVEKINAKGGEQFLLTGGKPQFSKEEVVQLIRLCHPDKHGGDPQANDLTAKLLTLRKS